MITPITLEGLNTIIKSKDVLQELGMTLSKEFNDSSLKEQTSDKHIVDSLNKLVCTYLKNELNNHIKESNLELKEIDDIFISKYLDELIHEIRFYEGRKINNEEIIDSIDFNVLKENVELENRNINELFQRL